MAAVPGDHCNFKTLTHKHTETFNTETVGWSEPVLLCCFCQGHQKVKSDRDVDNNLLLSSNKEAVSMQPINSHLSFFLPGGTER